MAMENWIIFVIPAAVLFQKDVVDGDIITSALLAVITVQSGDIANTL
jgi:hypothetical protein